MSFALTSTQDPLQGDVGGLTGFVLSTMEALGEVGVGSISFLEVVFPPIPSEVVLPLAGYLVYLDRMNLALVIALSVLGSVLGSVVLYFVGKVIGLERAAWIAERVPLMDADDVYKAADWFHRHEAAAVFTGRFVPGIRSLISLPAGASHMSLPKFVLLTTAGSGLWNVLLVSLGLALGTQYELVEQYGHYIDYVFYAAILAVLAWAVTRRVRTRRAQRSQAVADH